MKKIIKQILFGKIAAREYSTITIKNGIQERVYLEVLKKRIDISNKHWLLCLEPVVFGIWLDKESVVPGIDKDVSYKLIFAGSDSKENQSKDNILAIAELVYVDRIVEKEGMLFLLKLKKCKLFHISLMRTWLLYLNYYKKSQFSYNKFKSFVTAYSFPRKVRLISFKEEGYFNIFPMDLLGPIPSSDLYVFGLRHSNVALSKIISTKKIVVSEISFKHKDTIYRLGKHHGNAPASVDSLLIKFIKSKIFGFPVPEWLESYKEIEINKTINLGSHMLLWGTTINETVSGDSPGNLYHIHFLQYLYQQKNGSVYHDV